MNSITFTALARWADDQGCEIVGMHEMPGAMQYADGALVLLYSEDRDGEQYVGDNPRAYCIGSLHVNPQATNVRAGLAREMQADAIQDSIDDLMCGDRDWQTKNDAERAFATWILEDCDR